MVGGRFGFCTVNTGLNTPPSFLGLWSDAEAAGAPVRSSVTVPNRAPRMGKVTTAAFSSYSGKFSLKVIESCLLGGPCNLSVVSFTLENTGRSSRG